MLQLTIASTRKIEGEACLSTLGPFTTSITVFYAADVLFHLILWSMSMYRIMGKGRMQSVSVDNKLTVST
jgi:hypothetical protein